jgi:hypothetical protein
VRALDRDPSDVDHLARDARAHLEGDLAPDDAPPPDEPADEPADEPSDDDDDDAKGGA